MNYPRSHAKNLPQLLMWGVILIIFAMLIALSGYLLVTQRMAADEALSELHKQIYVDQRKRIKAEAETAAAHALQTYAQAEAQLKADAKNQVHQAISIINALYQNYRDEIPETKLKEITLQALRDIRFFDGRGYLFINDKDGINIMMPIYPELEGKGIFHLQDDQGRPFIKQLSEVAEANPEGGFAAYRWYSPASANDMQDKVSFVQKFEPYDWIVGTGDYLYQLEAQTAHSELSWLGKLRLSDNGYIAIIRGDGTLLRSAAARHLEGMHTSQMGPKERASIEAIITKGESGGGFLEYDWYHPNGKFTENKLSFVLPLPIWNWILVAGVYPGDLNALITERQEILADEFQENFIQMVVTLFVLGLATSLITLLFTRWLSVQFVRYESEIEEHQRQLEENTKSMQISARIVSSASEGILVTDKHNKIIQVNEAFIKITGYTEEDVLGQSPRVLSSGKHNRKFYKRLWTELYDRGVWQGEVWNQRKDGTIYPEWLSISLYRDKEGNVVNHIATFSDISRRKEDERQLNYLASYDTLTDLPNRRTMMAQLSANIAHAKRHPSVQLALLFIDLDLFKKVNDSLGHAAGDEVLVTIAERLRTALREGDLISRIGGDEFVALISDQKEISTLTAHLAERITLAISEPIFIQDHELMITSSVGIAVYPQDGVDAEALLKSADTALDHAKNEGRNNYQFFTSKMNELVMKRLEVEARMRIALSQDEFQLHYQPQVDLVTGRISSVEALIRWPAANFRPIFPDEFIPIAEESGQIIEIGRWTLEQACRDMAKLASEGHELGVSVNISTRQLRHTGLLEALEGAISQSGLSPSKLTIEITETSLLADMEQSAAILQEVRDRGIGVSLDDFGTGYSSLTFLKTLPVNELKVDRSFIDGLPQDCDNSAIAMSLIYVAHKLHMTVVAEGVETEAQQNFLAEQGCDFGQGYFYAKALPVEELKQLLKRNQNN